MPHTNAVAEFGREMTAVPGTRARPEGNLQLPTTFQTQTAGGCTFGLHRDKNGIFGNWQKIDKWLNTRNTARGVLRLPNSPEQIYYR